MKNKISHVLILGFSSLISCLIYLAFCYYLEGWGFPLDDAWIHHTFAKNFAGNLQWSFRLGELSGGSTGPAWGLLLAPIYWLKINPLAGTFALGYLLLWSTAVFGARIVSKILPNERYISLGAGLILAFEWHLVWAAMSGMETIVIILLILIFFDWLIDNKENWWVPGLLIGVSIWIRPDGYSLVGPAVFSLLLRGYPPKKTWIKGISLAGSIIAVGTIYFAFNWIVAGEIWPNTFYAKQAEYAILRETPFLGRFFQLSKQSLTGVGVLLVPGLIIQLKDALEKRRWEIVGALIWSVGFIAIYAWGLPVTYQHGRYIMPAIPIFYLVGFSGLGSFVIRHYANRWFVVLKNTWLISTELVLVIFLFLGAKSYSLDVAVINIEMVNTALWIDANLEQDAVIAAHDIGALGYYSERQIIDLAGLVTPDVIPFIRDEDKLRIYISKEKADYLVTFPSWYPKLTKGLIEVYNSGSKYSARFNNDNMVVFEWE